MKKTIIVIALFIVRLSFASELVEANYCNAPCQLNNIVCQNNCTNSDGNCALISNACSKQCLTQAKTCTQRFCGKITKPQKVQCFERCDNQYHVCSTLRCATLDQRALCQNSYVACTRVCMNLNVEE